MKFIIWLITVLLAPVGWTAINNTSLRGVAWIALFMPLLLGVFLLNNQEEKSKKFLWAFVFLLGLEASFLLVYSYIFAGISLFFVVVKILINDIDNKSINKSSVPPVNALLISILAFFTLWGMGNYMGICFKELRYISDEQKIRIAVADFLKNRKNNLTNHDAKSGEFYKDVDDFLRINKNCCSVSGSAFFGDEWLEWANRLCGNLSDYVYVSEPNMYKDKPMIPDNSIYIIAVTNCGNTRKPSS
ncbi:hypothetical protein [Methylomonas fluvii]|uniref:Uncharacterized protein n=1 Tax=Methylomonas fluvii TaxID=1854564 RepID=A0ABR9DLV0_9GAMM|nr:hypothetical protein [Methylomonas fluvii]MBD9362887.1 hypothetical protein [Methylomonas fluvii]CAD6876067.1 hypothetical protein [Methylomonas fluvii]